METINNMYNKTGVCIGFDTNSELLTTRVTVIDDKQLELHK